MQKPEAGDMFSRVGLWGALGLAVAALLFGVWVRVWPDVETGKRLTETNCSSCHDLTATRQNKRGPFLWEVVNRVAGSVGYDYSAAFLAVVQERPFVWDEAHLKRFIMDPAAFIPMTRMVARQGGHPQAFVGIKSAASRRDIVAFLNTLK